MPWHPPRYAQTSFLVRLACYVTRISPQLSPSSPVPDTVVRRPNGLFYSTVDAGQLVRSGARLGYVTDFFGEPKQEVVAPFDGLLTMVVGTPPVSTGEPLVTIAKIEQKP